MLSFGHYLIDRESRSENGVVAGKTAIFAVVDALVRKVEGGKKPHRLAEVPAGDLLALLGASLQLPFRARSDQLCEASYQRGRFLH
jgi:hypothetical protein